MPELFIELFSEEIPAGLQARGADELRQLLMEALAPLSPRVSAVFSGPRRIAVAADLADGVATSSVTERGPRATAPDQAVAGFARKHGVAREALREEGGFWMLDRTSPGVSAADLVARAMPGLLRRFAWPKSMRWGGTSAFTWIRPLRRILCLLDEAIVPFDLATEGDDGHGLAAGNVTEGHRFMAPDAVAVRGVAAWREALLARHVVADAAERARLIRDGIDALAASHGLAVVEDAGLVNEVAGLVEWPVPLLGRIDHAFMDLPPEVVQVSMRVNQRYFALRTPDGQAAPWFAFVANIAAEDGGAAIVAGNERVLRARFADARHFWDLDRRRKLVDRVAALDGVTFHAELGSQGDRVRRLVRLAGSIAPLVEASAALAERAALLAKADLTTGMVGEFPELQGVMGGYYAAHDGEDASVAKAVREHYKPKGTGDGVPSEPVSIAVALADKLDQLAAFFSIGEKPTGSGDPFALRRAALGIIRIIRETSVRLDLKDMLEKAVHSLPLFGRLSDNPDHWQPAFLVNEIVGFISERLRLQLKSEGGRSDVLLAVSGSTGLKGFDINKQLRLTQYISDLATEQEGRDLLAAYKRAVNLLRIEEKNEGRSFGNMADAAFFEHESEHVLHDAVEFARTRNALPLEEEHFAQAITAIANLRTPLDVFFQNVMVNAEDKEVRRNRLALLSGVTSVMDRVAKFSVLEG